MAHAYVFKRDGRKERIQFDKITTRIDKLYYGLDMNYVDPIEVTRQVVQELASETAAYLTSKHPDYAVLAARIAISNLHKETKKTFSHVIADLYNYRMISKEIYEIVMQHAETLDSAIIYNRDFHYNFFGFKTIERSYLLRINGRVVESPAYDHASVLQTYNLMSEKYFIHASPTLFNAGTPKPQMSSCFLQDCGGIGLSIHNVRATGMSYIAGTNGFSNGIVPMLRAFDTTARYVDQGGNRRPGAFAIYLEPWHADIFEFLDLKKNHGKEEVRARDLFYALWICDLFMKRVEANTDWSLFCPNEAPGLHEVWGLEFEQLYEKYEKEGRARKIIPAQTLWYAVLEAQIETGGPFMTYKDAANAKSNQKNLGTIKSSNLCTEIIEYSSADETAVCNLASIALPTYIKDDKFDFEKLHAVTKVVTFNLNRVIDVNYYPTIEARRSNMRNRPIGVGVQGLADAFMALRMPFDSPEAKLLNKHIFETIYHAAAEQSSELAAVEGTYETYQGSPASQGLLQYDLWDVTPTDLWDWSSLKVKIAEHGLRNSLLCAPMPTASTSQMLGNNECFEPYTSNIYTRHVLAGEFQVVCPWLLRELVNLGLWDDNMKDMLIAHNGSIQALLNIPDDVKAIYKTVWEISQKQVLDLAADRGAFICQSQSLNVHLQAPTLGQLTSMHFYGWKKGLKTGMYYLRTRPAAQAIQVTVDQTLLRQANPRKVRQSTPAPVVPPVMSTRVEVAALSNGIPTPVSSSSSSSLVCPSSICTSSETASSRSFSETLVSAAEENAELAKIMAEVAVEDPEYAAALMRQKQREYEADKLACSLENKETCVMCSG
ncbi:hypothetical protein BDZ89DRAFT_1226274 [Hymenopellis radicata]|nr:hypothetical protein BDZ89DRAFT_1226274 [Hymenopellis radicata]